MSSCGHTQQGGPSPFTRTFDMKNLLLAAAVAAGLATGADALTLEKLRPHAAAAEAAPAVEAALGNATALVHYAAETWNCDGASPPCPGCKKKVPAGSGQSPYGCADFVAHTLVAGGYISGLQTCGNFDSFSNYHYKGTVYNLNSVTHLMPFLKAAGWKPTTNVVAGTVCAVVGSDGPFGHAIVGVGKGVVAAHNNARWSWPIRNYEINLCLDPPGAAAVEVQEEEAKEEEAAAAPALRGQAL